MTKQHRKKATEKSTIDIDRSLFFKLLLLVNITAKPFSALYERRYRISLTEWRVMFSVAQRPGIQATELSELLGLDKMTVSRAVQSLERRRRIVRTPDEKDRRRQRLTLSKAGSDLYDIISPAGRAREELLMSSLGAEQKVALATLLDRLVDAARRLPD